MSFGDYLFGVIGVALVAIPIGVAAVRLRSRLLPGWDGAPARLAEAVLGVSVLTILLQVLGAIGVLVPGVLILASIAIGLAAHFGPWLSAERTGDAEPPPAPPIPAIQTVIAIAAAAFVAAHWATGLQDVWARGMLTFDTLWYHAPFAARIADEGSVWGMHFIDPLYLNWFYPENSELHHAAGIVLFDRDVFSPLVNFGWLGVTFLAAWCIGRPYRVAPLTLVAVAIAMDTGPMVPREAGTPATDTAPVALLLAAAAILINAWAARPRRTPGSDWTPAGALLTAGLALGVALGTKLTVSGAVAVFAAGVPLIVPRSQWKRALLLVLAGIIATAGFWFLRNLIHSGNPLPWLREIGPIELPGPNRGLEGRDDYTVAHYIFENPSTAVWSSYFLKAFENLLGPLWFAILGGAAGGALLAIWRPRSPAVRLAGVVTIAAAIAYLFTPLTAAGPEGRPDAFGINLRYLAPGLALGLALLPLEPKLTPERLRLPLLIGGLLALLLTSFYSDADVAWDGEFASVPWAALIGIILISVPVALALLARRNAVLAGVAGGVLAIAIAAVGWARQDDYLDNRYATADSFRFQLDDAVRWAKPTSGLRIGVAGTSGAFNQYGFYGDELANYVQYIGRNLPQADFRAIESCTAFREAVNEGGYDYLVTTPELDLNDPGTAHPSPEGGWMAGDPAAERVLHAGRTSVYRITGELSPDGCGKGANLRNPAGESGGSAADQ